MDLRDKQLERFEVDNHMHSFPRSIVVFIRELRDKLRERVSEERHKTRRGQRIAHVRGRRDECTETCRSFMSHMRISLMRKAFS